jgi:ABC-type branched-subunit amino acid transport system ATPase component
VTPVPRLAVRDLTVRFGSLVALDHVSLAVARGERRGIIGPNGAGKSTLFNAIAGEVASSAGGVVLDGRDITRLPPHRRASLGMARTFQTTMLCPRLTVLENVILSLAALRPVRRQLLVPLGRYRGLRDEAQTLLGEVGLDGKAAWPVRMLGHGEQRQVEILLALAQRPAVLLLDEPTAGLAAQDAARVTAMLRERSRDATIVLIEHDMEFVFDVVERITVLHYGRIVAEGTPEEIRAHETVREIYLGGTL